LIRLQYSITTFCSLYGRYVCFMLSFVNRSDCTLRNLVGALHRRDSWSRIIWT